VYFVQAQTVVIIFAIDAAKAKDAPLMRVMGTSA
jgi:hypothetical protein